MKKRSNTSILISGIWSRQSWENNMTKRKNMFNYSSIRKGLKISAIGGLALTLCLPGFAADKKKIVEIRAKGSDTLVQLAQAWSEAYQKTKPNVRVNVNGGGSGTGFAALQNNQTDICNASREIKPDERIKVKEASGKEAKEFATAYDALAVYANPANPTKQISVEELREIWAEGGTITDWEQVNPAMHGKITLFGRQNNSGTYDYFREHVCGKKDGKQREFRPGISE